MANSAKVTLGLGANLSSVEISDAVSKAIQLGKSVEVTIQGPVSAAVALLDTLNKKLPGVSITLSLRGDTPPVNPR